MPLPPDPTPGALPAETSPGPDCVIVMPALNEANHIAAALGDLLAEGGDWPILVLDGGSTDGTRSLVREIASAFPRVQLIDNPAVGQSAAVNRGARLAMSLGARVLIRADAHARYPRGFARGMVQTMDAQSCDSVVTPLIATLPRTGSDPWLTASVKLQSTWLGTGGAPHRQDGASRFVSHGHHAAFRLRAFLSIGGYDDRFVANEDAEYDLRLARAGGEIYLQTKWPVAYTPRRTAGALFRQYYRNGRWRVMTAQKHAQVPGLRQLLPIAVVGGVICALVASLFNPWLSAPVWAYAAMLIGLSHQSRDRQLSITFRIAILAAAMHFGFGLGAIVALMSRSSRTPIRKAELA